MMKLKTLFMVFLAVGLFACNDSDTENSSLLSKELTFLTEEYKPLNYAEEGELKGLSVDLVKHICQELNAPCEIELKDWSEAYTQTLQQANTVLFSTALNEQRKDSFKWVGPILSLDWNFYTVSGRHLVMNSLEDAKALSAVGVIKGHATHTALSDASFTNLVLCNSVEEGISKLLEGTIDVFNGDDFSIKAKLEEQDKSIYSLTKVYTYQTDMVYLAFNLQTSDDVVTTFQEYVDKAKRDGTLRTLTEKYLHTSDYPDVVQVYTEPYPPLSFMNVDGDIDGLGYDVASEIMRRNNTYYSVNITNWSNAYQMAEINPNFVLFTMEKTDYREDKFQWVGPIGNNTTWIYTKANSSITISELSDAKALGSIGVVGSWFSTQSLEEAGFTNLNKVSTPEEMVQMLMADQVDAVVCTGVTFPDILHKAGYTLDDVDTQFDYMNTDYYIAFSNSTNVAVVNQWQEALDAMKDDGTFDVIMSKWMQ